MIWISLSLIIFLKEQIKNHRLKDKIPYQKFFDGKRKQALPEPL